MRATFADPLIRGVAQGLARATAITPHLHLLVAVSGGADSVALLHALATLRPHHGFALTAAHFHHGLRGAEADADAAFVRTLATSLGIALHLGAGDVRAEARRRHLSIETAARHLRYTFLHQIASALPATGTPPGTVAIVTAHQADDQAETVLMRLARGAGTAGLGGIRPQSAWQGLPILHPMLAIPRTAITAFLTRHRLPWREDASNQDVALLRNRIRHRILPMLRQTLNPAITETLGRIADIQDADHAWLESLIDHLYPTCLCPSPRFPHSLDLATLQSLPPAATRRILRRWLSAQGIADSALDFERIAAIARLLSPAGPTRCALPGARIVTRRYGRLDCLPTTTPPSNTHPPTPTPPAWQVRIRLRGETRLPELGLRILARRGTEIRRARPQGAGRLPATASISRKRLGRAQLQARTWQPGDRMRPLGMPGSRKLQDIFTDAALEAEARTRLPIIVCGSEIVWIPGYRLARGWEVTAPTDPILELHVERL